MLRRSVLLILASLAAVAPAQFVYPKPEYNMAEPGLYKEDPFIREYRRKFFAVFRGDFPTFEKAYGEVQAMVAKNPKDARALVWLGNGQTVKGGLALMKGKREDSLALLEKSRKTLNRAVALRPNDPNIYMMRAATLYIQGQYWPAKDLPRSTWEHLRDDCLRFERFLGDKMPRVSIHLRGETYGELGIAYVRLGEKEKARAAFQRVIELCPGTDYETRARKEIEKL
jgi:tetratricopeptide (TPR) repeat protein